MAKATTQSVDCTKVLDTEFLILRNPANDGVESGVEIENCKCIELPKKEVQRYVSSDGKKLVSWIGQFSYTSESGKVKKLPIVCNGKVVALDASYTAVKTVTKSGYHLYNLV